MYREMTGTMDEEQVAFVKDELIKLLPEYEIASEHKPSRVILLAKKRFYDPEKKSWETWIDFDRFHELFKEYVNGKRKEILADEYTVRFTKNSSTKEDTVVDEATEEQALDD